MAEPFTIYKLTILYMLDKAGFPLSNTQISNFFLEKEYTDYFRVQEVIGDLVNADLINFKFYSFQYTVHSDCCRKGDSRFLQRQNYRRY